MSSTRAVLARAAALATLLLAPLSACASAGPPPTGGPEAVPPLARGPTTAAERAEAANRLEAARASLREGDYAVALSRAEEIVVEFAATPASSPALLVAARAALELEDFDGADRRARRYAGLFPGDEDGARPALDILADSRERRTRAAGNRDRRTLVLGAIVPQSGSRVLERYGELVMEGARLAIDTFRSATERDVDLRVADDGSDQALGARLVLSLEEQGADGILGPLLSESLTAAADARVNTDVPMISPTASEHPSADRNAYTLNGPNPVDAETLADYALRRGFARVAIVHPRTPGFELLAAAFRDRLVAGGREPTLIIPYAPEKTTFRDVIEEMTAAGVEVVYAPTDQRGVRQLAPQLAFLGDSLATLEVLGNDAWASDEVLRLVEPGALEGVVAATSAGATTADTMHAAFVERYESTYRRTLDNPFPALAYDATLLLLRQAAAGREGEEAQGIAADTWHRGATGWIGVRDGIIVRRPRLVRIEAGRVMPIALAE
ncbi:MAG: penicillin-binding protein activator [Gemmatimonadota bacterium]